MMNLADPELELIDPTPNVHSMFLHFDKTFFWGKLSSRCVVRWSKRMYSCAGTCSYEGRGGLCDIAISEPLLKLRPRKDLVETLLHEMIHAFLFVTKQDQNRDGHGPNFQAHMHRINRAAGLNISIYHDFHDEVELYQTHWWRCNGPCQFHRPYFGIVRRTNNRVPGPSDFWWNRHQRNCGGTFIKIKEPDKVEKETKKTNKTKPNADITKYIINNNKGANNKNITQNEKSKKPILKDSSNVPVNPKVGIKSNNSSTVVVTKKNVIFSPQVPKLKPVAFNGKGLTVGTNALNNGEKKRTSSSDVINTVRNVWANKQIGTTNVQIKSKDNISAIASNLNKHKLDNPTESSPVKMKKIDDYFKNTASSVLKDLYGQDFNIMQSKGDQKLKVIPKKQNLVGCPVCNTEIESSEINKHLDECLNKDVIGKLSKNSIPVTKIKPYLNNKNLDSCQGDIKQERVDAVVPETEIKREANITNSNTINLSNIEFVTDINQKRSRTSFGDFRPSELKADDINKKNSKKRKSDSFKGSTTSNIPQSVLLENTSPIYIDPPVKIEPGCSKIMSSDSMCPCCGDKLNKTVDEHLDECLSFFENNNTIPDEGASTSYTTIVIEDDAFDDSQTFNATGTKSPCPCCLKMIEEIDMNSHLDKCLS